MNNYAIFVGRFQPFHKGHAHVVDTMIADGFNPIVLVGQSQWKDKESNPFSFTECKEMILNIYPDIIVEPIQDHPDNDFRWAKNLDQIASKYSEKICPIYYCSKNEDIGKDSKHYLERIFSTNRLKKINIKEPIISARHIREAVKALHGETLSCLPANPFLRIRRQGHYYYAERRGIDSVAFILYNTRTGLYGLINEYKPPLSRFMITAFGGSLDKDIPKKEIVKQEVIEESGYIPKKILPVGSYFVSTQMNQMCHLYLVEVEKYQERKPQDHWEEQASVVWMDKENIMNLQDWKAKCILIGTNKP